MSKIKVTCLCTSLFFFTALLSLVFSKTSQASTLTTSFPYQDAGITAYVQLTQTINLDNVSSAYRVIEFKNDDFIIGSVAAPDFDPSYDVHVFVSHDGWILAYYDAETNVSKIFDWVNRKIIPTNLERVLSVVANKDSLDLPQIGYCHFDYPDATHLHLIKKTNGTFSIEIPSTINLLDKTWEFTADGFAGTATLTIDGATLANFYAMVGPMCRRGTFTDHQLSLDDEHSFQVTTSFADAFAGLALIYELPEVPVWIHLESVEQSEKIPLFWPDELIPKPVWRDVYLPVVWRDNNAS